MFKHPKCGGQHQTVAEARQCETTIAQTHERLGEEIRRQDASAHRTDTLEEFYGRRPSDTTIARSAILRSLAKQHENNPRITPRDLNESVRRDAERHEDIVTPNPYSPVASPRAYDWAETRGEREVRQASRPTVVTEDGIYLSPSEEIYKVVFNKASGDGRRLYAKQLHIHDDSGEATTGLLGIDPADARTATMSWEYAPGAMRTIRPEWKMSEADATRFGKLYGRCFKCHRALTKEESIARSMGDICAGKQGF